MINAYFALKEREIMNAWELVKLMEKMKAEVNQLIKEKKSAETVIEKRLIDE